MTMNATDPATAARIQNMLGSTAQVVERAPIPEEPLHNLRDELQALCQRIAEQVVEAEGADGPKRAVTALIAVVEAVSVETVKLQRWLWDEAAKLGVSQSDVARARGVTQQTQQRIYRRTQKPTA